MSTKSLLARLDQIQPTIHVRDMHYRGKQPLRYTTSKVDPAVMGYRANIAKVAVNALAERMRIHDVTATVKGRDVSERARRLVRDSDFPMTLQSILVDMLAVGSAYLIVWTDLTGRPVVTGESAEQVIVERHPVTRAVTAAVKRWEVHDEMGRLISEHVIKYLPYKVIHLRRDIVETELKVIEVVDNPLGVVPVIPLVNVERIHDDVGYSVVDDLAPLVDALNKIMVDMLTASEAVARPKRYATGVELDDKDTAWTADEYDEGFNADDPVDNDGGADSADDVDDEHVQAPFKDSDDMWITEQAEAKFGQLAGADLNGYRTAVDLIIQQIMAITALPAHMVGITTANPSTAEALRASEIALADKASSRIRVVNRPVEWALRLLVAVDAGVSPDEVTVDVKWADTATRSHAQDADAAAKLTGAAITTTDEARDMLGTGKEL